MNVGQINTLASLFCGDPNQTRFTPAQYLFAANRAQEQFCFDTKALWKDASTITTVDGTATYSLPSDFMWEKAVMFKGLALKPISRATLAEYKASDRWDDDAGTPKYFYIDPEEARKTIGLYPIPRADDAGANLVLTYYPLPTALTADSDTPLNSYALLVEYHIAIACYAAWLLLGYETASPEIMAKRGGLLKQYNDKCINATDRFKNTSSEPMRIRGGR